MSPVMWKAVLKVFFNSVPRLLLVTFNASLSISGTKKSKYKLSLSLYFSYLYLQSSIPSPPLPQSLLNSLIPVTM